MNLMYVIILFMLYLSWNKNHCACVHEFSFNGFISLFFIVDSGWLRDDQKSQ